jgi:hypothetical protein
VSKQIKDHRLQKFRDEWSGFAHTHVICHGLKLQSLACRITGLLKKAIGVCTGVVWCAPAWLKAEPPWMLEGIAGQRVHGGSALGFGKLLAKTQGARCSLGVFAGLRSLGRCVVPALLFFC